MRCRTSKTRLPTKCDVCCSYSNATSSAATAGTTAALMPHVRPNTVGLRDFHGNIDNSKAVAVNRDVGHLLDSTFAETNPGDCAEVESCELMSTGHIPILEEDVSEGACLGEHHVVAATLEDPLIETTIASMFNFMCL